VLEAVSPSQPTHFEDLYAADAAARETAGRLVERANGTAPPRRAKTGGRASQ
jgi:hypothetical protein